MIREWWDARKARFARQAAEDRKVVESLQSGRPGPRAGGLQEQAVVDGWATQGGAWEWFERLYSDPAFLAAVTDPGHRRQGADYPFFFNESQLAVLRDQSRNLCRMNSHAEGLIGGLLAYTIGTGASVRVAPKEGLADDQKETAESLATAAQAHADHTAKRNNWTLRQQEFFTRSRRDGDGLFRLFFHDDGQTDVRFVWPEQLKQPAGHTADEYAFGVKPDPDDGETFVEYAVEPVGGGPHAEPDLVPAGEIIHVRCNVDSGVRRGCPDFTFGVSDLLTAGHRLELAMGEQSRLQACIAYVRQHTNATASSITQFVASDPATRRVPNPLTGQDKLVKHYEPGQVVDTNQNTAFLPAPYNAGIAGHLEVSKLMVRSACAKWNAPEWLGSSDASNNNFASSLTAESPFVIRVKLIQQVYAEAFRTLFERVIAHAVACGLLDADTLELCEVIVTLPNPETRNRLADAQTAALEIPLGVDSRQSYADRQGRDWAKVHAENERYLEETGGAGGPLPIPGDPAPAPS